MAIGDFLNSSWGKIIIGLLWGFGLAAIIFNNCRGRVCAAAVYNGPDPKNITESIYKDYSSGICYQYKPYISRCD